MCYTKISLVLMTARNDTFMSIPPSSSPPPGGYYAAPPPASNSGGCWKIGGIGCAALFLLALIGGVLMVRNVKNQLAHPEKGSLIGTIAAAGKAGMDGVEIQQAVVRYHSQQGKYPASLMDLVRDGSLDGKKLHNDLDDTPDPGHVSWRYFRPREGAPGTSPILEEPYHITVNGRTQPGHVVILLNGRSGANSYSSPSGQ